MATKYEKVETYVDITATTLAYDKAEPDVAIGWAKEVIRATALCERSLTSAIDREAELLASALAHAAADAGRAVLDLNDRGFVRSSLQRAITRLDEYEATLTAYSRVSHIFTTVADFSD